MPPTANPSSIDPTPPEPASPDTASPAQQITESVPVELLARPLPSAASYHSRLTTAAMILIVGGVFASIFTHPPTTSTSPALQLIHLLAPTLMCCAAAVASCQLWRRIGRRGRLLALPRVLPLAILLGSLLPTAPYLPAEYWMPLALAAGLLLPCLAWVATASPLTYVHPVAASILLLLVLSRPAVLPDSLNTAADALIQFTHPHRAAASTPADGAPTFLSPQLLLREQLPPLEHLIVGGQPRPPGLASQIVILTAALYLLWLKHLRWQPLLACAIAAFATFAIAPLPLVIIDGRPEYQWMLSTAPGIDLASVITLAAYEFFAGTTVFAAVFIMADAPHRPFSRRGQLVSGLLFGCAAMLGQLYLCPFGGPFIASIAVGLMAPLIDRAFPPKTLL